MTRRPKKVESLFYLATPLEHIDFHIFGYWTSTIWSLWHIYWEETCCHHIGYSFWEAVRDVVICTFPQTGQHIPQPLMDQLWTTGWNGKKPKLQMFLPYRIDPPCRRIQTFTAECSTAWPTSRRSGQDTSAVALINMTFRWIPKKIFTNEKK